MKKADGTLPKKDYSPGYYGMAVGDTGNGPLKGPTSNAGDKSVTRGASVQSGLSAQESFASMKNGELGLDNRDRNQVPIQPSERISTDRGDFTCY